MKVAGIWMLAGVLIVTMVAGTGFAQEPSRAFTPGFSGYVMPMVGIHREKSLSDVNDDNRQIASLDDEADAETEAVPLLRWNAGYTLGNGKTRVYAGSPKNTVIDGSFLLELGMAQRFENGTILSAAYVPHTPLLDDEVWKDPFVTGQDRQETDREAQAFRLEASRIWGSVFSLAYTFATQSVDEEQSGFFLAGRTGSLLRPEDVARLQREADFHHLETAMELRYFDALTLRPALSYMRSEADGSANSFDQIGGKLALGWEHGRFEYTAKFSVSAADYDESNPVFDEQREDKTYGVSAGISYLTPFGVENLKLTVYSAFSKQDSNISFYDREDIVAGIGVAWQF